MKYVFAGGMTISVDILEVLCQAGYKPEHAFGYPPSLKHRSNYCPLDDVAGKYGFPVTSTKNINARVVEQVLQGCQPDWFMVFGWSQLVKEHLLRIPKFGTLGFHMTILPEGRGRAPVAWTLIKGKEEGGVTLLWLEPGADNGPIAIQKTYSISSLDDAEIVVDRVNRIACEVIKEALPDLRRGMLPRIVQDDKKASNWEKRTPEDGIIGWEQPASVIYNLIRGVTRPFPGAFTYLYDKKIVVWKAGLIDLDHEYEPGHILGAYRAPGYNPEVGIAVAARDGLLIFREIQLEDGTVRSGESLLKLAKKWQTLHFSSAES